MKRSRPRSPFDRTTVVLPWSSRDRFWRFSINLIATCSLAGTLVSAGVVFVDIEPGTRILMGCLAVSHAFAFGCAVAIIRAMREHNARSLSRL